MFAAVPQEALPMGSEREGALAGKLGAAGAGPGSLAQRGWTLLNSLCRAQAAVLPMGSLEAAASHLAGEGFAPHHTQPWQAREPCLALQFSGCPDLCWRWVWYLPEGGRFEGQQGRYRCLGSSRFSHPHLHPAFVEATEGTQKGGPSQVKSHLLRANRPPSPLFCFHSGQS